MTSWFRSWHGAPTDSKWLVIAKRANVAPGMVSAVFWALLDTASQADERGSVAGFDAEAYALWAGWDETAVQSVIDAMKTKGVIGADGRLAAWDKRQPKREDDSTERVKQHRERQKAQKNASGDDVTQCNAVKRTETHVTHTEPDTDTETDNNKSARQPTGAVSGEEVVVVDSRYARAVRLVESNGFGLMTPIMAEKIHAMLVDYPDEWIERSFEVAVKANKRRLDYVLGVLENWRRNGFDSKPQNGAIRDNDRQVDNAWAVLLQRSSEARQ